MGNGLLGNVYMNPNMPPEVIRALAERGFAPDGSRLPQGIGSAFAGLSTQQRLDALNSRISQDWQQMGFNPPPPPETAPPPEENIFVGANSGFADTGPDPFGQETRAKLDALNQRIDADMAAMEAPQPAAPRNAVTGMGYTPPLPAPMPKPPVPKPTPKPRPSAYIVKAGDNPTKIARMFGMSLKELEAKNPGLLKRARKMRVGSAVNI